MRVFRTLVVLCLFVLSAHSVLERSVSTAGAAAPRPVNLHLSATPSLVDVGGDVTFTLSASAWPGSTGVLLTFVSRHHGFSGHMQWESQCSCFRLAVFLAKRIHSIETATATATVSFKGGQEKTKTYFLIRGLAPNGGGFAPGGQASLQTWVSDPTPTLSQTQHYCAWVTTADGLGVPGLRVRFLVHISSKVLTYDGGSTDSTGLACVQRLISGAHAGQAIKVDTYAGNLHASTAFVVRK